MDRRFAVRGGDLQKAVAGLANAESNLNRKAGRKAIATVAREAIQMAEDSRIITVKKIEEEQLANERQAGVPASAVIARGIMTLVPGNCSPLWAQWNINAAITYARIATRDTVRATRNWMWKG